MKPSLTAFLLAALPAVAFAQHVTFPDHAIERGYYDAPYLRYEAEPGMCSTNATVLVPPEPYSQIHLQAEASNCCAVTLSAAGEYVEWTCDEDADGITVRFSLPDSPDGAGLRETVAVYAGDEWLADIVLDSYWAWQYTLSSGNNKYPDNTPATNKFARMRFDEKCVLLPRRIKAGEKFSLRKTAQDDNPVTIDFVELEPVPRALTADDFAAEPDLAVYGGDGSTLLSFINNHPGKLIFLPAGTYDVPRRLLLSSAGTRLVGAGMWHTVINFSTPSDARNNYSWRGLESSADNMRVEGLTLTTVNNKRYYDNNPSYQVGKGLQGSWGANSVIRDVRVEHFECGAWIADYAGNPTCNLTITRCRFRNNYADGVNLCSGVTGASVTHCSFRNNGDDDMASWSTGNMACDNTFAYCTAENNWRASSLAFYGGDNLLAHHLLIADVMEAGVHANGEFEGPGFGDNPSTMRDISIRNAGCMRGRCGYQGDFWGNPQAALHLTGGYHYDLRNLRVTDVDIYGARGNGIVLATNGTGRAITGLQLHRVHVHSAGGNGLLFYDNLRGDGVYSGLRFDDCATASNTPPSLFRWVEDASGIGCPVADARPVPKVTVAGNTLSVAGACAIVYTLQGIVAAKGATLALPPGGYVVDVPGCRPVKVVLAP